MNNYGQIDIISHVSHSKKAAEMGGFIQKNDLDKMPEDVKDLFGFAIDLAQAGQKHSDAKPLKGFKSAGVLEVVENDEGGTYRAVYTVKLTDWVYVLHCFQKKSMKGIETPKADIELIRARLKQAEADHAAWLAQLKEVKNDFRH